MLALATARADGDTSVPEELRNYEARSRQGKQRSTGAVIPSSSADWILPISDPPIGGGAVAIDDGRIVVGAGGVTAAEDVGARPRGDPARRSSTLTRISSFRICTGAFLLHRRFLDWVRPMLAARRERTRADDPGFFRRRRRRDPARSRDRHRRSIGDVTNTLAAVPLLREAGMPARVFHELMGFTGLNADEQVARAHGAPSTRWPVGDDVRLSLAPHAPYSVSPALFAAIRRDLDDHGPARVDRAPW